LHALALADIIDIGGNAAMSDLLIRKISPRMKRQIQDRARARGRSLSEEAKDLLGKGLNVPEPELNMGTWLRSLVPAEDRGDDLVFEYRGEMPKPPDFE
jgi:plasmid stability protein